MTTVAVGPSGQARQVRVLVVEDSPTSRALLVALFRSSGDFVVVGEAADGEEAVERAIELSPDLVVMDVYMPRMDGIDATQRIMREAPTPIVMVSSTVSKSDVAAGLTATEAGALMLLPKPVGPSDPEFAEQSRELLRMCRAMAEVKVVRRWSAGVTVRRPSLEAKKVAPRDRRPRLIAVGTSTGGPAALHRILTDLPRNFPVPMLVVQHMSHGFIEGLVEWLARSVKPRIKVAEDREQLAGGTVYVAPDDRHLGVTASGRVALSDSAPRGGFRPSADFLFESCAAAYGASLEALILTGMGHDGVRGLEAVRSRGGHVVAQDEASSVVFGMAMSAIERGLVDDVLPLESIGAHLHRIAFGESP